MLETFLQVSGKITKVGNTSRKMSFEAFKVITLVSDSHDSAANVLDSPVLVAKASATAVVTKEKQRKNRYKQKEE